MHTGTSWIGRNKFPKQNHTFGNRFGRCPEQIDFCDYLALGMVWHGAKCSHRVWDQFAHTFGKSDFRLKMCSRSTL